MDKETSELGIWLKTFFVFISALTSAVFFFLYLNRYIIFNRAAGANGSLTFVKEKIVTKHAELFTAQLLLNTDKTFIRGTDVKIKFDASRLELVRVMPSAKQTTTLNTFTPLNGSVFDYERVIAQANQTGIIEFSAITANVEKSTLTAPYTGVAILAELTFRSLQPGETTVAIVKNHPTHDSTIIEDINPPQNILSKTNTLIVTSETVIPSPTPVQ